MLRSCASWDKLKGEVMGNIIEITDINAPELDAFARLTENQLRSRKNPEKGKFIAESRTVVELALDAGCEPLAILAERGMIEGQGAEIIGRCGKVPVYTAEKELLEGLIGFALSRGILALMKRPQAKTAAEVCEGASRIAVLENIMDATNVGAIIRSAAALGVDGVLLSPSCSDPLIRRAARVSMGTVFQIPWAYITDDTALWAERGVELLHELGFKTAAMALSDSSVSISDGRLKAAERLAIILGTEGTGLTAATVSASDFVVKIPMEHGVDSLNVAAASAVAFWELGRHKM